MMRSWFRLVRGMSAVARAAVFAAVVVVLPACAGLPDPSDRNDWRSYAAKPVSDIRFSSLLEWRPLDRDSLLLRFDRNRYFVIQLQEPCISDVREANSMRLVQSMPNRLNRFDRVVIGGRNCRIEGMRPFDFEAFRRASDDQAPEQAAYRSGAT
ncbi:MAG: DUF6491 family protein [Wenzhouxiangellaceae bacterium]|nr:DUF6491 family protein [Wenzhouxiangellaceae bacterium]